MPFSCVGIAADGVGRWTADGVRAVDAVTVKDRPSHRGAVGDNR